jgi:hypothetical protein
VIFGFSRRIQICNKIVGPEMLLLGKGSNAVNVNFNASYRRYRYNAEKCLLIKSNGLLSGTGTKVPT